MEQTQLVPDDEEATIQPMVPTTLADVTDNIADEPRFAAGYDWLDQHIRWRPHELCVMVGPYGCGKSTFSQMLALKWALGEGGHGRDKPIWLATLEDHAPMQVEQIKRAIFGGNTENLSERDQERAENVLNKFIYTPRNEIDVALTMDWYLAQAVHFAENYGTNFMILDPFSEFDHEFNSREMLETQYVKQVMRKLRRVSESHNIIFIVVTHITKSRYAQDGGIAPFRVADAVGSVQFGSSADRGICVLRTSNLIGNSDHSVINFDKIKIEGTRPGGMGVKGTVALTYLEANHEYAIDHDATADAAAMWNNGGRRPPREDATTSPKPHTTGPIYGAMQRHD